MVDTRREFHAVLEQVESNLFRASYRGEMNAEHQAADIEVNGPQILPDTHIGTDPDSVRAFVEQMARNLGYETVIWDKPTPDEI